MAMAMAMATAMAMSLGPTSLYPDKPSPKNDPFFGTSKKNRSVRTIKMAVVSRRDLSFSTLSRRKPFPQKRTFWRGDDGGGGTPQLIKYAPWHSEIQSKCYRRRVNK